MSKKKKFYKGVAFIIACLGIGFLGTFSCTNAKQGANGSKVLSDDEQQRVDEYRAEVDVGRNMAGRLLAFYGAIESPDVVKYVNQVGQYVGSYSDFPDRRYMIHILNTEQVNAFACPGGYILVTLGTLRNVKNEAELAGILGHEVAHVGRQHMFNALKTMNKKDLDARLKKIEERSISEFPESVLIRKRPEPEDSATGALVARYFAGGSAGGLSIIQTASAGMSVILETGLDKELEFEADREGVKYAVRSGYAPFALPAFLKRLAERKKMLNMAILDKTHPSSNDRIAGIADILNKMDANSIVGAFRAESFVKVRNMLPAKAEVGVNPK